MTLDEILERLGTLPEDRRNEVREDALQATARRYFVPNAGPQTDAYFSPADELFYGGGAGGGKSALLCGLAIEEHSKSIIFRREYPQIKGLVDEAMPQLPAPVSRDDARRLQEIERDMRKPRGESRYWEDADMRDEYLALLERAEGRSAPAAANRDTARKTEIDQILREDRDRYFRDEALQREFSQILERESAPETNNIETPTEGLHAESNG